MNNKQNAKTNLGFGSKDYYIEMMEQWEIDNDIDTQDDQQLWQQMEER